MKSKRFSCILLRVRCITCDCIDEKKRVKASVTHAHSNRRKREGVNHARIVAA